MITNFINCAFGQVGSNTQLSQLPRARSSTLLASRARWECGGGESASDSTCDRDQGGFTSPA